MEGDRIEEAICIGEDPEEPVQADTGLDTLPQNHHPRKLPNIPRNPEIYEPSPGIFKYIRKENRTAILAKDVSDDSVGNCSSLGGISFDTSEGVAANEVNESKNSFVAKGISDEMSVELECYDEAAHIVCMSQQIEPEVFKRRKVASRDNRTFAKPASVATKVINFQEPKESSSSNPQNLYRPPKLEDRNISGQHLPSQSAGSAEIQKFMPEDSDDFTALKSKLNRAMQLYTLQRRQLIKLSGRVKSLTRKNQRLSEQAQASTSSINQPSPCLATDTKYVILFENLIRPEAMKTIMNAIATADKS